MPEVVPTYLVWMDLEMSGLDPDRNTILEIATLISDNDLHVVADGPVLAVHHPAALLDAMDD
jgi:oligoribonuclease